MFTNVISSLTLRCTLGIGLLITALVVSGRAQSPAVRCEAPPAINKELEALSGDDDAAMTSAARKEKHLAVLRSLLRQHPDDLFVHRRYQDVARGGMDADPKELIEHYRTLAGQHPNDPVYLYLYGRLLIGRKTPEAREQMEKALRQDAKFPWPHLALANIYGIPRYKDKTKSNEAVKAFVGLCPAVLNPEAYRYLSNIDDRAFQRQSAEKLRARLAGSTDPKELTFYDTLWQLEFSARPVPEHAQVRQQVEADLKKLRQMNLSKDKGLPETLRGGYKLVSNKEEMRWAEDQIVAQFPRSESAKRVVQDRWREENPYPDWSGPQEKIQAHYAKLMVATEDWVRRWPDDSLIRSERFNAVAGLKDAPLAEVEAASDALTAALERDPGRFFSLPPTPLLLARTYLKRNIRLDRIPELVQRGFKEVEDRAARDKESDWSAPGEKDYSQENVKYVRWMGWPTLAEAYVKTNQLQKTREVLRQMETALAKEKPGEKAEAEEKLGHSRHEATVWEWMGRVAEAENHKLDALAYYQNALAVRPPRIKKPTKDDPDEVADKAQKLWKELGGTDEGWANWSKRGAPAGAITEAAGGLWEPKNKALPDFEMSDLNGRTWRLADLKGKVAFINIWATWCGPCQQELPYVQKLHERLKNRQDVVVMTLNIDQEIGLVEPYVKERKFTFPVLPAYPYVEGVLTSISIPRNWVVDANGTLHMEQVGFGSEGDGWLQKALDVIQKAGAAK